MTSTSTILPISTKLNIHGHKKRKMLRKLVKSGDLPVLTMFKKSDIRKAFSSLNLEDQKASLKATEKSAMSIANASKS